MVYRTHAAAAIRSSLKSSSAVFSKSSAATALRLSKEAVIAANTKGLYDGVAHELKLFSGIFETADAKEGVAAFLEKRKPTFNKENA